MDFKSQLVLIFCNNQILNGYILSLVHTSRAYDQIIVLVYIVAQIHY